MTDSKGYALTDGVGIAGQVLTSRGAGEPATWGGSLANAYYGVFHDETDQPIVSATQAQVVTFSNTDSPLGSGVSLVGGTDIKVANAGTYNFQFSFQLSNDDNTSDQVARIWMTLNGPAPGSNIAGTSSLVQVQRKNGINPNYDIVAFNFVFTLSANDFVQVWWYSSSTQMALDTVPATPGSPTVPQMPLSPSVVCTVTQVR